jgi:hypothetical protein
MKRIVGQIALSSEGLILMRRGLGILCILDALLRLPSVTFMLSDIGVLPRSLYYGFYERSYYWSLYLISGLPSFAVVLLLLTVGLSVLQVMNKSTRTTRIVLWMLMVSVQNRHPAILDSSDDLLRLLLFWDIFLPEPGDPGEVATPASVGLQVQLSVALAMLARSMTHDSLALSAQWGGNPNLPEIPWMLGLGRAALVFLAVACWIRVLRIPSICFALPVLLAWALVFHPVFPITIALATLCYYRPRKRSFRLVEHSTGRPQTAFLVVVMLVSLALNYAERPGVRRHLVPVGQALGLLQNWSTVYPIPTNSLVSIAAKLRNGNDVWGVSQRSSRRERMLAQKISRNISWANSLSRALQFKYNLNEHPAIWMKVDELRPDFRLSSIEVRLLTATPTASFSRKRVAP